MVIDHSNSNPYLPPEIFWLLLPYLTRTGLSRLSQTCKLYRTIFLQPLFTNINLTRNSSVNSFAEIFGIDVTLQWPDRFSVLLSSTQSACKDISVYGLPTFLSIKLGTLLNNYIPLIQSEEQLFVIPKQPMMKTLLVPFDRIVNHRLKGGVYGIITAKSTLRYKDMELKGMFRPCLQFPSHGRLLGGTGISKFVKSLCIDNTDLSDNVLQGMLANFLPFLNILKIKDCKLVSDKSCKAISTLQYLTKLSLIGLPRITNSGLVWISKCLNLEYLSLKNTLEISECGLKHIFYSCPFLKHLDLERLGVGNGFGIGKEIVPYLLSYAQSLTEIVLPGCMLDRDDLKSLCRKSKIQKYSVGYSTVRTRDLGKIKEMVMDWTGAEIDCISQESSVRGKVIGIVCKDLKQIVIRG